MAVSVLPGAEPYAHDGGDIGVLLVHGYTSTPQSMRGWAEHLAGAGYTVRLPRLPGHGTPLAGREPDPLAGLVCGGRPGVRRAADPLRPGLRRRAVDGRAAVDQAGPRTGAAGGRADRRQPDLPPRQPAPPAAADAAPRGSGVPQHRQRREDGRWGARAGVRPEPAPVDALPDPSVGRGEARSRPRSSSRCCCCTPGWTTSCRCPARPPPRAHLQHRRHRDLAGELVPCGHARQRRPADPR